MDEELKDQEIPEGSEEDELSHTDKLVGVFSEPSETFTKIAQYPPRTIDWLLPILLLLIVAIAGGFLMMSNPQIKQITIEKQMERIEETYQGMVDGGQMTQEQMDQTLEQARDQMEQTMGPGMIINSMIGLVAGFVIFFIITGYYFVLSKFALKGDGSYQSALVANGLPAYISMIQWIVIVILALSMDRPFSDTSVASFLESDTNTIVGWFLGKLDIFTIWGFAILSIGLSKMFKSESTTKYYILVFGSWIGFSLIWFLLKQAVPFLQMFGG